MARLKKEFKSGNGDLGLSTVIEGHRLRKDSPACKIQGSIEKLRITIEKALATPLYVKEENVKELWYLLNWFDRNLFSLATFCYLKGNTDDHVYPDSLLVFLNNKTPQLRTLLGNCEDFQRQGHPVLIQLDSVRVSVRQLESDYVGWWYSSEIQIAIMSNPELLADIQKHAAILNRLSAYLFELVRYIGNLLKKDGVELTAITWQSKVEPFEII
jgi:cob(I)alamin adenosyltransferase